MIRVLLVDDKASIREEIRSLLELEEDIQVIGEAADGWEAIERTTSLQPDLILMDKAMPSLDGIQATRLIKKDHPQAKIIFLAAEKTDHQEALQAGAEAFLLKDHGFHAVVQTIKKTMEPHPKETIQNDSRLQNRLINGFQRLWTQNPALTIGLLILPLVALSNVALLILPLSALELIARALIHYSLAAISLLFGLFFFAYALKYYANVALILLFNGENGLVNGNGHVEGKGFRNGLQNGLRKIFTNGVDNAFANGYHLKPETQPFVSIHLPLYNEKEVVDRLLTASTSLDYENYEVVVADDSTDETTEMLERWAEHPRVKISHRQDRRGFKGGALQVALQRTDPRAEFIVVFDADFIPPPDVITQFLAYFYSENGDGQRYADDRVAVVQGYQWHMLNANENWITRGIRVEFSGSYVIERPGQQLLGSMKMISGSVFMIRADLLRKHGWGISITEDWELTLRLYLDGYKVLYTPFIQAPAECISHFQQLVRQRMRWARGHTFNVKRYFWRVLTSPNISRREKVEFLYYAPYYLQSVFFIIGTACWFISELILHRHIPYWTALFGWSLLFTNMLALVMANLAGLFLERGVHHNWSGIFSFVALSNLLVPFQAYAALKGLLEKDEGGWHRTPKSGRITEILGRLSFGKKLKRLLPKGKKSRLPEGAPALVKQMPIEELGLSVRLLNLLRKAGITQVGQILERLDKAQEDLLAIRGFGPKSLEEVRAALKQKGFLLPLDQIEAGIPKEIYEIPIERLSLSTRVFNLLKRAGITLVGQILQHLDKAKQDVLAIHYFGPRALLEVKRALYRQGLLSASQVPLEARLPSLAPPKLAPLPARTEKFIAWAYVRTLELIYLLSGKLEDKGLLKTEKRASRRLLGARGSFRSPRLRAITPVTRRRSLSPASTIIMVILVAMLGLTVMALKVETVSGAPDAFYFHALPTSGIVPPGGYMNNTMGSAPTPANATLNTPGQSVYAYTDIIYPTGNDDGGIAAGNYSFHIHFINNVPSWGQMVIWVEVGYCNPDGSGYTQIVRSNNYTVTSSTTSPQTPPIGNGSAVTFTAVDPKRIRFQMHVVSRTPGSSVTLQYDQDDTGADSYLSTPTITVPERAITFLILAPLIPLAISLWRRGRRPLKGEVS